MIETKRKVPKNTIKHPTAKNSVQGFMLRLRDRMGGPDKFFESVHGRPPVDDEESIKFNNYVRTGAYGAEVVAYLAEKLQLQDVTLGDLFLNEANVEYFDKVVPKRNRGPNKK